MNVLISACLLGQYCRYDGQVKVYPQVQDLLGRDDIHLIPVCPEQAGVKRYMYLFFHDIINLRQNGLPVCLCDKGKLIPVCRQLCQKRIFEIYNTGC